MVPIGGVDKARELLVKTLDHGKCREALKSLVSQQAILTF